MREAVAETNSRRRFLRLLAASPLVAFSGLSLEKLVMSGNGESVDALDALARLAQGEGLISAPEQAINVMEFEAIARAITHEVGCLTPTDSRRGSYSKCCDLLSSGV